MSHRGLQWSLSRAAGTAFFAHVFALVLLQPAPCTAEDHSPIVIRGSSTLLPIVEQWAKSFAEGKESSAFDIVATGTSEGIEELLAGRADIAMASRPLDPEEIATARDTGVGIREVIVARMGIVVIVNRQNPVSSLAVEAAAEIFSGLTRSWTAVGGPNEAIVVVRKDSGWSPEFFRERIMGARDYAEDAVIVDSKEGVVVEVGSRPWSIGVTGMPEAVHALDTVSLIRLEGDGSDEDSTYALSRPLYLFSREGTSSARRFLDYVTAEDAQAMIIETGFYPARQSDSMQ